MRRYRFPLEALLRVRRIEEAQAALALAMAQQDALAAEQQRTAAEVAYAAPRPHPAPAAAALVADRTTAERRAARVVLARHRADDTAVTVGMRRDDWRTAAGRVTGLERLDERAREAHRADVEHDERAEIDDLVTTRFRRTDDGDRARTSGADQ